jgi:flagellar biosynthesis/type III secretory pathway protein FliH
MQSLSMVRFILEDARKQADEMISGAAVEAEAIKDEARRRSTTQSIETLHSVSEEGHRLVERTVAALEQEIAKVIVMTVRQIIGSFDPDDATKQMITRAIVRLLDHDRATVICATDMAEIVRSSLTELKSDHDSVPDLRIDPNLSGGRVVFSSEYGHVEIGTEAQIATALEPWAANDVPSVVSRPGSSVLGVRS